MQLYLALVSLLVKWGQFQPALFIATVKSRSTYYYGKERHLLHNGMVYHRAKSSATLLPSDADESWKICLADTKKLVTCTAQATMMSLVMAVSNPYLVNMDRDLCQRKLLSRHLLHLRRRPVVWMSLLRKVHTKLPASRCRRPLRPRRAPPILDCPPSPTFMIIIQDEKPISLTLARILWTGVPSVFRLQTPCLNKPMQCFCGSSTTLTLLWVGLSENIKTNCVKIENQWASSLPWCLFTHLFRRPCENLICKMS